MNELSVKEFQKEVESALKTNALPFRIQIIIQSPRSFKANFHLYDDVFIAVRYNTRNARMDFALIQNQERIFGFDNLKEWHYHPFENPEQHILCEQPAIEQIIAQIKSVLNKL